ncbi:MAG: transglycosylase SLT domain-containing protein [Desulfobacterales bacterium]|nr:transglycosylase SLT domain-containing protein [Desulfobacterales bacterium]
MKLKNIQMKSLFLIHVILICWALLSTIALPSFADKENQAPLNESLLPSLVESVRFSEPLFFCGDKILVERQDIKENLEKEVLLALWDRPQVILWIKRASKFFPHMEKIIKEAGLPDDLKYVAIIESGLRPHVSSHKGAVGYWQFLRATGKMYGLKINYQIDERRNIFKSTQSACKYLKELNRQFDDWPLSVAAYNMGARRLKDRIKTQESNEFYSLYLSEETQRYVFKIIAAKFIMENYHKFGFAFQKEDYYPPFEFDKVNLNSSRQLPIALVAKAAGISFKTIKDMNPELRGYHLAAGKNSILVPKGLIQNFEARFEGYYAKWQGSDDDKIHNVLSGENLALIAKKYNVRLSSLIRWNNLSLRSVIYPGDKLIIESN